jgi:tetraacyldisaccharide 4'-kinase
MAMRAPDFWRRSPHSIAAKLLAPLGALYGAIAARRMAQSAPRAGLPTIVIGGPTAGGDGKTPLALAVAEILIGLGERPAFLTRGFGRERGMQQEPFLVDLTRHDARMAGDEPLLLATAAPTIVGADRAAAARLAIQLGATALILDDGLHSRRLAPDLAIGVLDTDYGLGNGLCLPAGPLRAPARDFFRLVDAIVTIGDGDVTSTGLEGRAKSRFAARLLAEETDSARLRGVRAFAFSGIARPDKFEKSLRELGGEIAGRRWFPDPHFFMAAELSDMARDASRLGAKLVTTQKDAARLSAGIIAELGIETLAVRLVFDNQKEIDAFVERAVQNARTIRGA